ncbi:MAG: DNA-protecting protein DprA [Saprospiraceae bacterium]|nr:DNA-protecting protein DprA [Saprospiraceae bacterium]
MTLSPSKHTVIDYLVQVKPELEEMVYKIGITRIGGIGPRNARKLINHFGSPKKVFDAPKKELQNIFGIGDKRLGEIKSGVALSKAEKELASIRSSGVRALYFEDDDYPRRLKQLPDAPIVLYWLGECDLNSATFLSVVGTRKPSAHGLQQCARIIQELKPFNPVIVSGLAYGIDVCAHRAALENDLKTIGVIAHGLDDIYPASHRSLTKKIQQSGGLLTEYPGHVKAEREFFPMRNRIIAGLSDATLVIETKKRGGSMITADLSNGYSRDVLALPGRPGDEYSEGCNWLIKKNKAQLVDSAEDIADYLGWMVKSPKAIQSKLFNELSQEEYQIVKLFEVEKLLSIDQIAILADLPQSQLAKLLLELEFKSVLTCLPGKRYKLL